MAGRKPIKDLRKVTLNLIGPSYDSIKRFAAISPSGVPANAFIREVIHRFGLWCETRLSTGQLASVKDLEEVEDFVEATLKEEERA